MPPPHVFISYAKADGKDAAAAACAALERAGVVCWMAPRDIAPGAPWDASIVRAIRSSRLMVLLLTPAAIQSERVRNEVLLASETKVPIAPVHLTTDPLSDSLKFHLIGAHWFDATRYSRGAWADALVREIATSLDVAVPETKPAAASVPDPPRAVTSERHPPATSEAPSTPPAAGAQWTPPPASARPVDINSAPVWRTTLERAWAIFRAHSNFAYGILGVVALLAAVSEALRRDRAQAGLAAVADSLFADLARVRAPSAPDTTHADTILVQVSAWDEDIKPGMGALKPEESVDRSLGISSLIPHWLLGEDGRIPIASNRTRASPAGPQWATGSESWSATRGASTTRRRSWRGS
jgi:hypothetical protein